VEDWRGEEGIKMKKRRGKWWRCGGEKKEEKEEWRRE
jgi:hypothetical protein